MATQDADPELTTLNLKQNCQKSISAESQFPPEVKSPIAQKWASIAMCIIKLKLLEIKFQTRVLFQDQTESDEGTNKKPIQHFV